MTKQEIENNKVLIIKFQNYKNYSQQNNMISLHLSPSYFFPTISMDSIIYNLLTL